MTDDDIPRDTLSEIDVLRVNYSAKKNCKCPSPKYVVDTQNHIIECEKCGAYVDPFAAMLALAKRHEELNAQLERMNKKRKEIAAYKPHLVVIKRLEREYRGRKMLPCCPHCKKPFYLEKIDSWVNTELAEKRGMLNDD